jgi:hypothetical protein
MRMVDYQELIFKMMGLALIILPWVCVAVVAGWAFH